MGANLGAFWGQIHVGGVFGGDKMYDAVRYCPLIIFCNTMKLL